MKSLCAFTRVLIAIFVSGLLANKAAAEENKRESRPLSSTPEKEKQDRKSVDRPPLDLLPFELVSGPRDAPSSFPRGVEKCKVNSEGARNPSVVILSSQSIRTVQEVPTLYWYLTNATACRVEVTLIETQSGETLVDVTVTPPLLPGIHSVRLGDYNQRLILGHRYAWSVSLVPEVADRAKDLVTSVELEYVQPTETLQAALAGATQSAMPAIYTEAGLFYDALTVVLELTKETPNTPNLREQRSALLEKIGMREVSPGDVAGNSTLER